MISKDGSDSRSERERERGPREPTTTKTRSMKVDQHHHDPEPRKKKSSVDETNDTRCHRVESDGPGGQVIKGSKQIRSNEEE